jgi:hypothetical protein
MKDVHFTKGVEKLVNPIEVGTLHYMQNFNNMMPKNMQKKMINKASNVTPYMGFVVEPYSYYLCYELKDLDKAKAYLPEGYRLVKTKIFDEGDEKYYGIFGCFNAHTSGFWGLRVEFYIIAENIQTGLMSWIIVDYDTNTITYDPKNGLSDANSHSSMMTTDFDGTLILDIESNNNRKLKFNSNTRNGVFKPLYQRLWVEGNLSITYGRYKSGDNPYEFSLIFDPKEFKEALSINLEDLDLIDNNWFPGLIGDKPDLVLCFPYAQHMVSDSPGHASHINSEEELIKKHNSLDFDKIPLFTTDKFKKMMSVVMSVLLGMNLLLVLALIIN